MVGIMAQMAVHVLLWWVKAMKVLEAEKMGISVGGGGIQCPSNKC